MSVFKLNGPDDGWWFVSEWYFDEAGNFCGDELCGPYATKEEAIKAKAEQEGVTS